jgi:hypothetical protein
MYSPARCDRLPTDRQTAFIRPENDRVTLFQDPTASFRTGRDRRLDLFQDQRWRGRRSIKSAASPPACRTDERSDNIDPAAIWTTHRRRPRVLAGQANFTLWDSDLALRNQAGTQATPCPPAIRLGLDLPATSPRRVRQYLNFEQSRRLGQVFPPDSPWQPRPAGYTSRLA